MVSPIAIDHRRVHSENGLFIGEEVVCLQTDIDEGIIKTSKLDIDNDSNIINIDHGNGDVELSISCSTTDGLNINDIISNGEEDDGGGDVLSCGGGRDGSSSGGVVGRQQGERDGDERCGVVWRLDARVGGDGALVWWRSVEAITLN